MTIRQLQAAFEAWRRERMPLVLASVCETHGSTYSKTGARMLVTGAGQFQGMLSGGCLEGDLAERAQAVLESGRPQSVTYDLGSSDEELWGLGVGCDGRMRIFLQPLLPESDYQPFAAMAGILGSEAPGAAVTVLASSISALAPGATAILHGSDFRAFGIPGRHGARIREVADAAVSAKRSHTVELPVDDGSAELLVAVLTPPPHVLILGAGLDAGPVLRLMLELGWRVTIQDHRPAYIATGSFEGAEQVLCEPADRLGTVLELDRFDAVVVMSHHLATDRSYLRQLAASRIPYIGLLGPPHRKQRLVNDLRDERRAVGVPLESRVHGPAGLDIGGDGPASIALSIVAQIHSHLRVGPR
jgi:xanthine/CO dehydrogenase XdhC/CoxF family maturation factor